MINIKRLFIATVVFTFFFVSSAVGQKMNQLDATGNRVGVWEKKYPNGKLRYTGTFKNGKEIGVFKFYKNTSTNFPHIIKEYSEGSSIATVEFYNQDGVLKTKGSMIGKNREGTWTYYYTNGKVFSEEIYKEGKLTDMLKNYYANGNTTEETQYRNGLKDGLSKIFSENGKLLEEVNYIEGKKNGPAKYYNLKGQLQETGTYKNDARFGKWDFYIDGEISDKPKRKTHTVKKSR